MAIGVHYQRDNGKTLQGSHTGKCELLVRTTVPAAAYGHRGLTSGHKEGGPLHGHTGIEHRAGNGSMCPTHVPALPLELAREEDGIHTHFSRESTARFQNPFITQDEPGGDVRKARISRLG